MLKQSRFVLISLLAMAIILSAMPRDAQAIPYKLEGYLRDENGVAIPLANISISGELFNMSTQDMEPVTYYRTTNEYGYYVIYLAANEPGGFFANATVTVSYTNDDQIASTNVNLVGIRAWANLTYKEKAGLGDFFMSTAGVLTLVVVSSALIIGYFILRSQKDTGMVDEEIAKRPEKQRRRK
jgi:hypothetical protein